MGWVTFWEVSQAVCERRRSTLEKAHSDLWGPSTVLEAVPSNYSQPEKGSSITSKK